MATMYKESKRMRESREQAAREERERAAKRDDMYRKLGKMADEAAREVAARLYHGSTKLILCYKPASGAEWGELGIAAGEGPLYNGWRRAHEGFLPIWGSVDQISGRISEILYRLPVVGNA